VKPELAPAAESTAAPVGRGTCPGDGHCDGTGGNSSCSGCPAFNNRVAKAAQAAAAAATIVAKNGGIGNGLQHGRRNSIDANTPSGNAGSGNLGGAAYQDIAPGPKPVAVGIAGNEMQCQNCGTTNTPLWRRDEEGKPTCNACGMDPFITLISYPCSLSLC
jgi:GATA-binding protein, other eukaryote